MTSNRLARYELTIGKLIALMIEEDFENDEIFDKLYGIQAIMNSKLTTARNSANHEILSEFLKYRIKVDPDGSVTDEQVYDTFKKWWTLFHGKKVPKGKALFDYITEKCGKKVGRGWKGISIIEDDLEEISEV